MSKVNAPEIRATRLLFLIVGFGVAAWAPLVPLVKGRAGLDDGTLGLLLLCLGIGSLATMPVAGALAGRFGTRPVLAAAVLVTGAALLTLSHAAGLSVLAAALTTLGIGLGLLDCLMNLQAVAVERRAQRPMMSGFHGLYSLGCILGAAGFSVLLSLGLSPPAPRPWLSSSPSRPPSWPPCPVSCLRWRTVPAARPSPCRAAPCSASGSCASSSSLRRARPSTGAASS
jgi:predicted MFS family arabinose efflux permease